MMMLVSDWMVSEWQVAKCREIDLCQRAIFDHYVICWMQQRLSRACAVVVREDGDVIQWKLELDT